METAEVNNSQAATFKSSLAGAAFISSRGEVYRLFQGVDDPTLGNDFLLSERDSYEFDRNKTHDQNEINSIDEESKFESDFDSKNSKIESVANTDLQAENILNTESCHLQISDSGKRFRVVNGDYESAVAELLALEVPKPIINVPENIPPQNVSLDEKIKRIRGVTGICKNFQATTQDKIIGNINFTSNNISQSNFPISKNPSTTSTTTTPVSTAPIANHSTNRTKSKIKLSFSPFRDNTALKIDEIVRDNLIPILDSIPDFFNTEPKTIRFVPNSKVTQIDVDESKNCPITDAESDNKVVDEVIEEIVEEVVEQNIVTIDDDENIDGNILPFPVDGRVCVAGDIDVGVNLLGRELVGYKLPDRIELLIGKAREWVLDLGDRFIDFLRAGKRVISVNGCFAGDGCSSVSVFAAVELASRGKRVLLVDANRRNPALADFLKVDEVLDREIVTLKNNLDFMTLHNNNNKTEIDRDLFRSICDSNGHAEAVLKFANLNTAAQQREAVVQGRSLPPIPPATVYDFVLFDSGCVADIPFNECVDNWRIMQVDGIFLVVSKKNFQSVNFNNIAKRLSEQQINLLGIMLCKD